ncbi:RNA polymerase sigma factor [Heyndrickxia vini]|uniref:Sigma-70 family RNA polymerase sigma factor n=1 Tax=Heyndrickxia vini TaxID=1476025 RepID=A0ABX7E023_9BACI|nr:sigma-70 family RNA polymerase sigma factor [Heyndrickxia vini]QQZ09083.1 sigma-70 family RNA polymerase sigma factor [Heyndrickxia vini]
MDDLLIEKVKCGNDHAFRVLVEKYRLHIFHTTLAILRNQHDAEDAAQEVFLKVYHSLPKYKNQGFKTWITRIAVNHSIDIKRKQVRGQEDKKVEFRPEVLLASTNIEEIVLLKEKQDFISKRLDELPENYREVVEGFYIKEKTYQQMSQEQKVQVKTIETKLYRARLWMKRHWKEEEFL